MIERNDDGSTVTVTGLGGGAAATKAPSAATDTRTRTLRGLGPTRPLSHACPACHVVADAPVDNAIAVCFGAALVFVRGAAGAKQSLCPRHMSMVKTLVDEMRFEGSEW